MNRFLLVLAVLLAASPAAAQPRASFVRLGEMRNTPSRDSTPITLGRFAGRHAKLGAAVRVVSTVLYAIRNDNGEFMLSVNHRQRPCGSLALRIGDALLAGGSSGSGTGNEPCGASFQIDAAVARRVATALSVPIHRRRPIGERTHATFEAPARVRAGEPVEVSVRIQNPSDAPAILRYAGGRQRGPRNNRFHFTVFRDGQPLAEIQGMDFGGLGGPVPLAPGGEAVISEQVGRWADVSVPGRYEVRCTYETELFAEDADFHTAWTTGGVWDRQYAGTVRFTVR